MPDLSHRPSLLFVYLGNICRSPLAEAATRARAGAAGCDWLIDSAGTGDWHAGHAPDPRAQAVALEHGIDISGYRARQVVREDFHRFDFIFALDHTNLKNLRRLSPDDATARLSLLLDRVPGLEGQAVAEPYYGDDAGFATTWQQVDAAARALVSTLRG
jgi:protein-tyrosine phosphatase